MRKSIVYVRTDFWGAMAVRDLLAQEKHCLAYAEANGLKVAKVFREKPWKRQKKGQVSEMLKYAQEKSIDLLVIYRPRNLARYKEHFIPLLKVIRESGLRVEFVIYKNN